MKRVLFVRHLALGDILLSFPILREYKIRHPEIKIDYYTLLPKIAELSPDIERAIDLRKIKFRDIEKKYDEIFFLSYEYHTKLHYTDGYSISTGIETENKMINIRIPPEYIEKANKVLVKRITGKKLIGIQEISRSRFRNYSIQKLQLVIDRIKEEHPAIEFITLSDKKNDLKNCINQSGALSLETAIGMIGICNYFLSIDSGFLHIAQALGLPCTAIFGSTLPELVLTSPENSHQVRNESLDCLGCFHERTPGAESLEECKRGDIACMNECSEENIIDAIDRMLLGQCDTNLREKFINYESRKKDYLKTISLSDERAKIEKVCRQRIIRMSVEFSHPIKMFLSKIFQIVKKREWERFTGLVFRKFQK